MAIVLLRTLKLKRKIWYLLLLNLRGRYFFHVDPGHWRAPSRGRICRTVTWAVADPESHAHSAFVNFIANSFDVTWAVQIVYSAACSAIHIDCSINSCWGRTLCAIKGEIPSLTTAVAVVDAEMPTPVDTQPCAVWCLLENTFLLNG